MAGRVDGSATWLRLSAHFGMAAEKSLIIDLLYFRDIIATTLAIELRPKDVSLLFRVAHRHGRRRLATIIT
jgi:hypothetical protein